MNIYPSILEKTTTELFSYLSETEHLFNHFQVDIADGTFVPNTTESTKDIINYLQSNPTHLPQDSTYEFHLMVEDFAAIMPDLQFISTYMPISEVILHLEPAIRWTRGDEEDLYTSLRAAFPFHFGIALNPEVTPTEHIHSIHAFPTIQIMTIHPGTQGSALLPETLTKISELRKLGYFGRIVLDGAMNEDTLPLVLKHHDWPDAICPGSYLKEDPDTHLTTLQNLVAHADHTISD